MAPSRRLECGGMPKPIPDAGTVEGFAKAIFRNFPKRYQLACGSCYEATSCEVPNGATDAERINQTAQVLFGKGWRWTDRPICPVCIRRNAAPLGQKKKVT